MSSDILPPPKLRPYGKKIFESPSRKVTLRHRRNPVERNKLNRSQQNRYETLARDIVTSTSKSFHAKSPALSTLASNHIPYSYQIRQRGTVFPNPFTENQQRDVSRTQNQWGKVAKYIVSSSNMALNRKKRTGARRGIDKQYKSMNIDSPNGNSRGNLRSLNRISLSGHRDLNLTMQSPSKPEKYESSDEPDKEEDRLSVDTFKLSKMVDGYLSTTVTNLPGDISPDVIELQRPELQNKNTGGSGDFVAPVVDFVEKKDKMDLTVETLMKGKHLDMESIYNVDTKHSDKKQTSNDRTSDKNIVPHPETTSQIYDGEVSQREGAMQQIHANYETCIDSGLTFITTEEDVPLHEWKGVVKSLRLPSSLKLASKIQDRNECLRFEQNSFKTKSECILGNSSGCRSSFKYNPRRISHEQNLESNLKTRIVQTEKSITKKRESYIGQSTSNKFNTFKSDNNKKKSLSLVLPQQQQNYEIGKGYRKIKKLKQRSLPSDSGRVVNIFSSRPKFQHHSKRYRKQDGEQAEVHSIKSFYSSSSIAKNQDFSINDISLAETGTSNLESKRKRKAPVKKGTMNHPLTSLRAKSQHGISNEKQNSVLLKKTKSTSDVKNTLPSAQIDLRNTFDIAKVEHFKQSINQKSVDMEAKIPVNLQLTELNNKNSDQVDSRETSSSSLKKSAINSASTGKTRSSTTYSIKNRKFSKTYSPIHIDNEIRDFKYNTRFLRSRLTINSVMKRYMMSGNSQKRFPRKLKQKSTSKTSTFRRDMSDSDHQSKISMKNSSFPRIKNRNISESNKSVAAGEYFGELEDEHVGSFSNNPKENSVETTRKTSLSTLNAPSENGISNKEEQTNMIRVKKSKETQYYTHTKSSSKEQISFENGKANLERSTSQDTSNSESSLSASLYLDSLSVQLSSSRNSSGNKSLQGSTFHKTKQYAISHKRPTAYQFTLSGDAFLESIKPKSSLDLKELLPSYQRISPLATRTLIDTVKNQKDISKAHPVEIPKVYNTFSNIQDKTLSNSESLKATSTENTTIAENETITQCKKKTSNYRVKLPVNKHTMNKFIGIPRNSNQLIIEGLERIKRKYLNFKPKTRADTLKSSLLHFGRSTHENEVNSEQSSMERLSVLENRLSFENKYGFNKIHSYKDHNTDQDSWRESPKRSTTYDNRLESMYIVPGNSFEEFIKNRSSGTNITSNQLPAYHNYSYNSSYLSGNLKNNEKFAEHRWPSITK